VSKGGPEIDDAAEASFPGQGRRHGVFRLIRSIMYIVAIFFGLMLASVVIYALVGGPKFPPGTDAIIEEAIRGDVPELVTGETGYASSDGLDIWYEGIAPEGASKGAVLLIMAMAAMR
jgi:hypothetical protein